MCQVDRTQQLVHQNKNTKGARLFSSLALPTGISFMLAICVSALSSAAAAGEPDPCQIGDPTKAALALAEIKPAGGADLREAVAPCPDDSAQCKAKTHLKKHELMIVTDRISGSYVCVYPAASFPYGGYVKQTDIQLRRVLPLKAWRGTWGEGDDWIKLRVKGTAIEADGEAFYSQTGALGGEHDGSMPRGPATPHNNVAVFKDPDDRCRAYEDQGMTCPPDVREPEPDACTVIVALDKSHLAVSDSGFCGGANVHFSGSYDRLKPGARLHQPQ